jgi:hypothetical protein
LSSMVKLSLAGQPFHWSCISTASRLTRLSHSRLPQCERQDAGWDGMGWDGMRWLERRRIDLQKLRPSVDPRSEKAENFRFLNSENITRLSTPRHNHDAITHIHSIDQRGNIYMAAMHSLVQPNSWVLLRLPSDTLKTMQIVPNTFVPLKTTLQVAS